MKVRIIIERSAWRFKLHIGRAPTGDYYAQLRTRDGSKHGAIITLGYSADAILIPAKADATYQQLAGRLLPDFPTSEKSGQTPGGEHAATVQPSTPITQ